MSRERWELTVRAGPKFERTRHATLDEALRALATSAEALRPRAARAEVQILSRRIAPEQQVAARLEIAGPGGWRATVRGGVDVRGDGSTEAFTGRLRRTVVEQRRGESAPDALRRVLTT